MRPRFSPAKVYWLLNKKFRMDAGQYQAYCREADKSEVEQPGGDSLPLTNLEDCLPACAGDSIDDRIARRDGSPSEKPVSIPFPL
jgi:hypothetical protein